ncbi:MAG TPA: TonB-dependent receptor [Woeseiaceae bacterium]|nr:TonB-dependent receptor [Woeseiaceae bacterium]
MTKDDLKTGTRSFSIDHFIGESLVILCSALSCIAFSGQVLAQVSDSNSATGTLEEITVTAQRREQRINDIPISITAISGQQIVDFGDKSFYDVANSIPNLAFGMGAGAGGTGNGFGVVNARGITLRGVAGDNATSYYIDDTPLPLSLDPRVFELERIEVLRGPQGTLFGSSSLGGTVRLITRQPNLNDFNAKVSIEGNSTKDGGAGYSSAVSANLPFLDNQAAVRLSAYGSYTPGIFTRRFGVQTWEDTALPVNVGPGDVENVADERISGVTGTLRIEPKAIDGLSISLLAMTQQMKSNGLPLADFDIDNLIQERPLDVAEGMDEDWTFVALTGRYDLSFGSIVFSTSQFERDSLDLDDGTDVTAFYSSFFGPTISIYSPTPTYAWFDTDTNTSELRFSSAFNGPFQMILGVYKQESDRTYDLQLISSGINEISGGALGSDLTYLQNSGAGNDETAYFADLTYKVTDALTVTGGVRYADLETYFFNRTVGWLNAGVTNATGSAQEDATTPRFTAQFQVSEQSNVYASAAKGFRTGGSTGALPPTCEAQLIELGLPVGVPIPFESDDLWTYEIGTKGSWKGNRLSTRAAVFYTDWNNIQQVTNIGGQCGGYNVTVNSGAAEIRGGEVEINYLPNDQLELVAGLGYTDSEVTDVGSSPTAVVGQELSGVPTWTGSLSGEFTWPTAFGDGFVRGRLTYTGDSISYANEAVDGLSRDSYSLLDLRAGLDLKIWRFSIFANNLTDERANYGDWKPEAGNLPASGGRPARYRYLINQPRTVGIEVIAWFR